jgi:hypothetical protein
VSTAKATQRNASTTKCGIGEQPLDEPEAAGELLVEPPVDGNGIRSGCV